MKNKILFKQFKLPVFGATVWVVVGNTISATIDYVEDRTSEVIIKKEHKGTVRAYTYAYQTEKGNKRYFLLFKHTAKPGEIAHEVKHLINILFSWHGYKLSLSNDEMECYYLEVIIDKVHNIIRSYKKG